MLVKERLAAGMLLAALVITNATPTFALVCGDADGSGTVTVTDGVQVLRAAAGLSSSCTTALAECDVDGSGAVTVTDGVDVLRLAAGLSVSGTCNLGNADVQTAVDAVVPFITIGLGDLAAGTSSSGAAAATTKNCSFGGTSTKSKTDTTREITLNACVEGNDALGHFQFDGTITFTITSGTVSFDVTVQAVGSGGTVHLAGSVQATLRLDGGFVLGSGSFAVMTPSGAFTLSFTNLTFDGGGHLVSGSAEITDSGNTFAFTSITITVTSATSATVHVVSDDSTTADFVLDLNTGSLMPAS